MHAHVVNRLRNGGNARGGERQPVEFVEGEERELLRHSDAALTHRAPGALGHDVIHRENCPVLLKSEPEQQLDADWASLPAGVEKMYDAAVVVSSADAHALLASMAAAISETGGNIASVDTLSKSQAGTEGFIEFRFNLNVRDAAHLQAIMAALHTIPRC